MPFRIVLGVALVLAPVLVHALGMGKMKVHSMLYEPLNAEIEFTSITSQELKSLSTKLAARPDFNAAGIDRPPYLSNIKFTVAKKLDGRYFLQLTTDRPIREPFLHLLLQVEWAGGKLLREYTALIDPPIQIVGKPAGITTPDAAPIAPPVEAAVPAVPIPTPSLAQAETETPPVEVQAPEEEAPAEEKVAEAKPQEEPLAEEPPAVKEEPAAKAAPEPAPPMETIAAAEALPVEDLDLGPEESSLPHIIISEATGWPVEVDEITEPVVELLGPDDEVLEAQDEVLEAKGEAVKPAWQDSGLYTVNRGDTLWEIAQKVRPDKDLAIEQTILAIYQANPKAFFRNNVNNLKAGKVLTIPEREAVMNIPPQDARREFRAQYDSWQEYKLKLASASQAVKIVDTTDTAATLEVEAPEGETAGVEQEAGTAADAPGGEKQAEAAPEKPVAAAQPEQQAQAEAKPEADKPEAKQPEAKKPAAPEKTAKTAPPSGELLQIVRNTLDKEAAKDQQHAAGDAETAKDEREALAAKVTALEESLDTKQMETKELGEKAGMVREQIENESRLIELENKELAEAQKQAGGEEAKPAEAAKAEEAKPAAPEAKAEAAQTEAAPAAPVAKKRVPRKRTPRPPPPPVEEPGILETISDVLGGQALLIVLAIVAVAGGGILLVYIRRRQKSTAEFQESILTTSELVTGETSSVDAAGADEQPSATSDTSFLSDFSQGGMGNIHTDEVDPIAEAEVYLAYGRDEQAEEILKEAVVKDPARQELKLKLLEIYNQRNDVRAFETLAEELYAAQEGQGGELWSKVEEMGRKLNPENPMFRGGDAAKQAASRFEDAPPMGDISAAATQADQPPPETIGVAETKISDDMGIDMPKTERVSDAGMVDFDMDFGEPAAAEAEAGAEPAQAGDSAAGNEIDFPAAEETQPPAAASDTSIDMSLSDEPEPAVEAPPALEVAAEQQAAPEEINFDMDTAAAAPAEDIALEHAAEALEGAAAESGEDTASQQWDETATKLDLAKAYIDMGDAEGARSILDEVLTEGNEEQKSQAAELAKQLA